MQRSDETFEVSPRSPVFSEAVFMKFGLLSLLLITLFEWGYWRPIDFGNGLIFKFLFCSHCIIKINRLIVQCCCQQINYIICSCNERSLVYIMKNRGPQILLQNYFQVWVFSMFSVYGIYEKIFISMNSISQLSLHGTSSAL